MTTQAMEDRPTEPDHKPCSEVATLRSEVTGIWASLKEFKVNVRMLLTVALSIMCVAVTTFVTVFLYRDSQATSRMYKVQDDANKAISMSAIGAVRITNNEEDAKEIKQSLRRIEDKLDGLRQ